MSVACPLCQLQSEIYRAVEGVNYYECLVCDFIFADPALLDLVDAGEPIRRYDAEYWSNELASAKERSFGSSLARSAEALLYCRIPVHRFVDIGTGPGYLLDALSAYLPSHRGSFYGVEKYPPGLEERSHHRNYISADLNDVNMKFECGVCIEVIEHLTPRMADDLASAIASVSVPGSLFLFNTGLTHYVRDEDPDYLDPYRRGHITSWSVSAASKIFVKAGFNVHALPGKSWAFLIEYAESEEGCDENVRDRIWSALEHNKKLLVDAEMGSVMYILGLESARAY